MLQINMDITNNNLGCELRPSSTVTVEQLDIKFNKMCMLEFGLDSACDNVPTVDGRGIHAQIPAIFVSAQRNPFTGFRV